VRFWPTTSSYVSSPRREFVKVCEENIHSTTRGIITNIQR
jgi:UPF0288 family protein (methanogenesis marker protein 3)